MERVKLLSTDQSSSEVRMTTTGLANRTGSTRTRAAKGLFSHFILLAGVMLIALLTSGKASAQNYTVTLADAENCGLTVSPGTTDGSTKSFTLSVSDETNYKLPTSLESVVIGENEGLTADDGTNGYTYSGGTLTIGSSVTIDANIVITASAATKSTNATLSTLTYSISSMGITDESINLQAETYEYTVELDQFVAEGTTISLTPTVTATGLATVTANNGVGSYSGLTSTATITVTAENGVTQDYTITFTSKDKLASVSAITVNQLTERYADDNAVITALGSLNANASITTTNSSKNSLPITWSYSADDNDGENYKPAGGQKNKFRWTLNDLQGLVNPDEVVVTGTVEVQNSAVATTTVLSSLTYKIGADGQPANVTSDLTGEGTQTYAVELPYGTATGTQIIVNVACKDNATAKVEGETATNEFALTLDAEGEASLALIITAEDGTITRTVTINFTTAEELVTAVSGVPSTYTLTQTVADEAAAIALLEAMDMTDITLTANSGVALKLKWEYSGASFDNASGQSNNFTWTVVKEDGSEITANQNVTATGTTAVTNYTVSTEAGINTLTYQVAGGTKETVPSVNEAPTTNDVTVAFGTKSITVSITPTDAKATVSLTDQPTDHGTLVDGVTSYETPVLEQFKFTITAEDGQTTKNFIIKFTVDKEKITAVTVPATYKLPETAADAAAAIVMLADMEGVVIKTNGITPTKLSWTYEASENGSKEYTKEDGKTNVFSWSAVRSDAGDALEAATGVAITGTTTVTNFMPAVTGDLHDQKIEITAENPVDKIGDGEKATIVNIVEVPANVTTKQLTINKAEIKDKLDLKGSVNEIVLNEVVIPEVILAENKTTVLTLQSGNEIAQITNAGTMTLNNAASIAPLSMAIETRAALPNSGAVKAVDNNGKFTDNTAKIVTVGGDADLRITTLPANKLNATSDVTLAIVAESTNGNITYQWEKAGSNDSWTTAGTDANLTVKKAGGNGTFRCKVVSTNKSADTKTTTLFTPSVSVTFKSASDPSTPSDPTPSVKTYTVTLKKVTGATFSKGETTKVEEGDDFSFSIKLDKAYNQSKPVVKVGTTTYEPDAKGVYTIKNITKDITIEVSGIVKNTSTGVEETTEDAVRVWSEGSTLYIHTPQAADVYVVSGAGALQHQLKAVPGDQNMQLPAGFYIVRVGTYTAKVIIR
ncbi:hypothetical protein [Parabacteroides sp.]